MSLSDIITKNKSEKSLSNTRIEYKMDNEDVEFIKSEIFEKVVKPINYKVLERRGDE